jgi:hypothetical protein
MKRTHNVKTSMFQVMVRVECPIWTYWDTIDKASKSKFGGKAA